MNFFNQGLPLGRWFRVTVIVHWTFFIYAAMQLFGGNPDSSQLAIKSLFLGLLFATVLLHEFGHALSCRAVGGEANQIILWPLGGIAFCQPPMNPTAWLITTVCGPLVNAILWPAFYFLTKYLILRDSGVTGWELFEHFQQSVPGGFVRYDEGISLINVSIYMWQMNKLLLLFNLIPAYPMDGGRILQELLWYIVGYGRSLMVAGMVGVAAGVGFVVLGLGLRSIYISSLDLQLGEAGRPNTILVIIGILAAMQSWGIYQRSLEIKTWRKN